MSTRFVAVAVAVIVAAFEVVPYSHAQSLGAERSLSSTPLSPAAHSSESLDQPIPPHGVVKLADAKRDEIYLYVERVSEGPLEPVPEYGSITIEKDRAYSNPHARMLRVMLCMHENLSWLGIDEIELHRAGGRRITGTWRCNHFELSNMPHEVTTEPPLGDSGMSAGEIFWTGPRTFSWRCGNHTYDFAHLGGSEFRVSVRIHQR